MRGCFKLQKIKLNHMKKRSINTSQAIEFFKKRGAMINEKEAEETLDAMYFLAEQIVKRIKATLKNKKRNRKRLKRVFQSKPTRYE